MLHPITVPIAIQATNQTQLIQIIVMLIFPTLEVIQFYQHRQKIRREEAPISK